MEFTDRELKCVECGAAFLFTAGEQEFYQRKGYQHNPKRCKRCRWSWRSDKPIVETTVNCAECGVNTTVPFEPKRNRPVLCSKCYFEKKAQRESRPVPQPGQSGAAQ